VTPPRGTRINSSATGQPSLVPPVNPVLPITEERVAAPSRTTQAAANPQIPATTPSEISVIGPQGNRLRYSVRQINRTFRPGLSQPIRLTLSERTEARANILAFVAHWIRAALDEVNEWALEREIRRVLNSQEQTVINELAAHPDEGVLVVIVYQNYRGQGSLHGVRRLSGFATERDAIADWHSRPQAWQSHINPTFQFVWYPPIGRPPDQEQTHPTPHSNPGVVRHQTHGTLNLQSQTHRLTSPDNSVNQPQVRAAISSPAETDATAPNASTERSHSMDASTPHQDAAAPAGIPSVPNASTDQASRMDASLVDQDAGIPAVPNSGPDLNRSTLVNHPALRRVPQSDRPPTPSAPIQVGPARPNPTFRDRGHSRTPEGYPIFPDKGPVGNKTPVGYDVRRHTGAFSHLAQPDLFQAARRSQMHRSHVMRDTIQQPSARAAAQAREISHRRIQDANNRARDNAARLSREMSERQIQEASNRARDHAMRMAQQAIHHQRQITATPAQHMHHTVSSAPVAMPIHRTPSYTPMHVPSHTHPPAFHNRQHNATFAREQHGGMISQVNASRTAFQHNLALQRSRPDTWMHSRHTGAHATVWKSVNPLHHSSVVMKSTFSKHK
jgi:hypothetical protein